jgi:malate synthase
MEKTLNESYYHRLAMEEFEKIRNLVGDENHEKQNTDWQNNYWTSLFVTTHYQFLTLGYKYI